MGRTCADGRLQRDYVSGEEATSPTIALELLFALLIIDAHKCRAVQTFHIPGEYLYASLPDEKLVHMKFE